MGVDFDELGPDGKLAAMNHVVRAKRQQMRYLPHSLQNPAGRFVPDDEVFVQSASVSLTTDATRQASLLQKSSVLNSRLSEWRPHATSICCEPDRLKPSLTDILC